MNNLAHQDQRNLSLESIEHKRQRLARWMTLNESSKLPASAMADAKEVLSHMDQQLTPTTASQFSAQMTACLTLCSGVSMTENERSDWLKAAAITLAGIPFDLLCRGCDIARKYSDHPSKIIPTIMREIVNSWDHRKQERAKIIERMKPEKKPYPWERDRETRSIPEDQCSPEEAAAIMKEFGLDMATDRSAGTGRDYSNLRHPTQEELAALTAEMEQAPLAEAMNTTEGDMERKVA